jgi:23S rRNA G2069 N7-methylase RlmK/C1962 C5-methylase RlmI
LPREVFKLLAKAHVPPVFTYLQQPLNRYTFKAPKIRRWVEAQCQGKYVLNLFAGPTKLCDCHEVTNDIDPGIMADYNLDALDCIGFLASKKMLFDIVLLDGPYSYRKSMEKYRGHGIRNSRFKRVLDAVPEILAPWGWVITFGYHSSVMSKKRGFAIREICLISHGGAQHDTIATVEERIKVTEKEITT